jgi:hypothetical protein
LNLWRDGDVTFERRYSALPPIFRLHWNWGMNAFTNWARSRPSLELGCT